MTNLAPCGILLPERRPRAKRKEVKSMRKYEYAITMENGVRHVVKGTSKKMVENELRLLGLPVAVIQRIYKSGKLAECPW